MGKNKLRKFGEMEQMQCVLQYPFGVLEREGGFPLRGRWHREYFHNANPIVLELGCGKGEYTVGLARRRPDMNFIGIDIKGARMYTGASQATREGLSNVAFLRTGIELLERFFAPGEVSEIWITFADPQMKKTRKRLTATNFLERYRRVMTPGGIVNLKTDSNFLYTYTRRLLTANGIEPRVDIANLYLGTGRSEALPFGERVAAPEAHPSSLTPEVPAPLADILAIRTHYEQQWLSRGLSIKYLCFPLPEGGEALVEPEEDDIPLDGYRSTRGRGTTEA